MAIDVPSTKSLLHFDLFTCQVDGSVVFTDESGKVWTGGGHAQIDTAQSKFGGAALLLDGTGDFEDTPDSADFAYGTGDFNYRWLVRFNALPTSGNSIGLFGNGTNAAGGGHQILLTNTAGTYSLALQNNAIGGALTISVSKNFPALATNTWYKMTLGRIGTTFYFTLNSNLLQSTSTDADAMTDSPGLFYIGGAYSGAIPLNGWLDNFEQMKGFCYSLAQEKKVYAFETGRLM